jgi:hypothetical protein
MASLPDIATPIIKRVFALEIYVVQYTYQKLTGPGLWKYTYHA